MVYIFGTHHRWFFSKEHNKSLFLLFLNTSSLDCLDPYDECFDIEEKKRFDASVLKYVVNEMEKIHHDFGELRECPFYCNLIGCFNEDGWIVGAIFGAIFGGVCILVLFIMVIVKIKKRTVRRIDNGGWK